MKIGPKFKIARRLGERVFPKTQTSKFTLAGTERKKTKHGGRGGSSEYGKQLLEKQKARYTYCVSEKQFSNYVKKIKGIKGSNNSENLFVALESRLDNVIFRLGLVNSRLFGRQAVSHGHILVNGRRITIPSYQVKLGDKISIRQGSKANGIFKNLTEKLSNHSAPTWLIFDTEKNEGAVKSKPVIGVGEANLNFESIFEFYSRV